MTDFARLKRLYMKDDFGPEFIQAAKDDLPYLFGRLNLLEEFYSDNAPGLGERSRILSDQLGKPQRIQRGIVGRLRSLFAQ